MSDDFVDRLHNPLCAFLVDDAIKPAHQRSILPDFDGMGGVTMEEAAVEITRLRAELATARRDAMEELERHFREAAAGTPLGHEDHQRGASTFNWLIYCATTISAIKDREP